VIGRTESLSRHHHRPQTAAGSTIRRRFCVRGERRPANLKEPIARLSESLWKPYREDASVVSECANPLNYWPEEEERPEGTGPLRYIAIRVRKRLGET